MKFGKNDSCVTAFQRALISRGHRIPAGATGFYGEQTKAACTAFQRAQGWRGGDADGLPGPQTFARLAFTDSRAGSGGSGGSGGGRVSSPVPGRSVTYAYGVRNSRYAAGFHTGNDYAAPNGTPVVAVRSGTVVWSNDNGGAYGKWLGLRADNGRDYVYCHLSSREVRAGTRVDAGQRLGRVGSTGNVTGPHLHFEDRPRGGGYGAVRKPSW
ncbi:peptidoglycan DD-metalloendopeptidase family protein [Streptomyces hainanensis]|uniref:peptidoglycan DD-metalloendopeptidase family protein n=1 Tax=Streptomyces hainanensis TaxID=402648 RepID=UPI001FB78D14|nr:peptidoglycan DD-metalloendopeptidase family protein [Streptomyces hainanensis]